MRIADFVAGFLFIICFHVFTVVPRGRYSNHCLRFGGLYVEKPEFTR
jgi:hypothetical protein